MLLSPAKPGTMSHAFKLRYKLMMQLMKRPLILMAFATMLVLALVPPAGAWLLGPGACTSTQDGVSTIYNSYKPCSGCIVVTAGLTSRTRVVVIDFKKSDYSGPVMVGLISNDSRLGDKVIVARKLGDLPTEHQDGLTDWSPPWWYYNIYTDLKPNHYYATVIYGQGDGHSYSNPFYRQCFLTDGG